MNVIEYGPELEQKLADFTAIAWADADREHYGAEMPNFHKEQIALLAVEAGNIIGYIKLFLDMGVVLLESLVVHPERKGQGIGAELLLAAEQTIKAKGAHRIWLETGSDWKARQFYEKHGYLLRSTLPDYYAHREFVILEKMF